VVRLILSRFDTIFLVAGESVKTLQTIFVCVPMIAVLFSCIGRGKEWALIQLRLISLALVDEAIHWSSNRIYVDYLPHSRHQALESWVCDFSRQVCVLVLCCFSDAHLYSVRLLLFSSTGIVSHLRCRRKFSLLQSPETVDVASLMNSVARRWWPLRIVYSLALLVDLLKHLRNILLRSC